MGVSVKIDKRILERAEFVLEKAILDGLKKAGDKFVKSARQGGTYKNRTYNLRSSIGYCILKNDTVMTYNMYGTEEGRKAAKDTLNEVPSRNGYRLIGLAGMDYAAYVEAKGYNVISKQKIVCFDDVESLKNVLKDVFRK